MRHRTVVLVSHHVQLCCQGADYIVALESGRAIFQGDKEGFLASGAMAGLVQASQVYTVTSEVKEEPTVDVVDEAQDQNKTLASSASSTLEGDNTESLDTTELVKKAPRKLIEEEIRAVGRIGRSIWDYYINATGGKLYWSIFVAALLLATLSPVAENGWLRCCTLRGSGLAFLFKEKDLVRWD